MADEDIPTDEQKNKDSNHEQEPSNAWIWIILFMLLLIILFFVLGGGKLLGEGGTLLRTSGNNQIIFKL